MSPRLRLWLTSLLGAALAVGAGWEIAQENYLLAAAAALPFSWILVEWLSGTHAEAWTVSAVILGYVLANRGFAQVSAFGTLPLLPAELALLLGGGATVVRMARKKTSPFRSDLLNFAILAWAGLAAVRLIPDLLKFGPVALRDFATVYYAAFFFIAQSLAQEAKSSQLLRRTLLVALALLPLTYFLFTRFTDFFLGHLLFRGVPILYYKDDLVAAYFFCGFFLLQTAHWRPVLRTALALTAYLSAFTIGSSRAAIVGLLVVTFWWGIARKIAVIKLQSWAILLSLCALAIAAFVQEEPIRNSRLISLYEHLASMTDLTGTGKYQTDQRQFVGDNNRFRLSWWRSVADEVLEESPVFGLGFGANLSGRFVRTYELDLGEDFTTRSPHSVVFTVLGRMGTLGLMALLAIVAAMAAATWRLAVRARDDVRLAEPLGWWSVAWIMFTSACFGVVLEGPMGAVLFWTALGMANGYTQPANDASEIHDSARGPMPLPNHAI
jgi:O-antigen ligase